jgi:hypothetical protein
MLQKGQSRFSTLLLQCAPCSLSVLPKDVMVFQAASLKKILKDILLLNKNVV